LKPFKIGDIVKPKEAGIISNGYCLDKLEFAQVTDVLGSQPKVIITPIKGVITTGAVSIERVIAEVYMDQLVLVGEADGYDIF